MSSFELSSTKQTWKINGCDAAIQPCEPHVIFRVETKIDRCIRALTIRQWAGENIQLTHHAWFGLEESKLVAICSNNMDKNNPLWSTTELSQYFLVLEKPQGTFAKERERELFFLTWETLDAYRFIHANKSVSQMPLLDICPIQFWSLINNRWAHFVNTTPMLRRTPQDTLQQYYWVNC